MVLGSQGITAQVLLPGASHSLTASRPDFLTSITVSQNLRKSTTLFWFMPHIQGKNITFASRF